MTLTDMVCALVIVGCGAGLLYLLNPDFEHFVATEIQPSAAAWSKKHLLTWEEVKQQFMEGYQNGQGSRPQQPER
jgi:hypothetical protein